MQHANSGAVVKVTGPGLKVSAGKQTALDWPESYAAQNNECLPAAPCSAHVAFAPCKLVSALASRT